MIGQRFRKYYLVKVCRLPTGLSIFKISGLKKLAKEVATLFPKGTNVLIEEIYVDDILPAGQASKEDCIELAAEIEGAVHMGGLKVKGFTFSGEKPYPDLSKDGPEVAHRERSPSVGHRTRAEISREDSWQEKYWRWKLCHS